jgi:hypothetical protein
MDKKIYDEPLDKKNTFLHSNIVIFIFFFISYK